MVPDGVVDRGLQQDSSQLASRGKVVPGLYARLVLINTDAGIDKFHVLQGLEDPKLDDGPERYFCFQRWGDSGGRGSSTLYGPTVLPKVEAMFAQVFFEKTGQAWGSVQPGQVAKDGKYWLQQFMKPNSQARWEYFVDDRVDGKKEGWYPYETTATEEVEELYAQHVADNCGKRTATRIVKSGQYSYKVDLSKMSQENMRTHTVRQIRRVFGATGGRRRASSAGSRAAATVARRRAGSRAVAKRKTTRRAADKKAAAPKKRGASAKRGVPMKRGAAPKRRAASKKATKAMSVSAKRLAKARKAKESEKSKAKAKVVSKAKTKKKKNMIARGKFRRSQVFMGKKEKTGGGMKKEDFYINKKGRVVSKKRSAVAGAMMWPRAVRQARLELGFKGFFPLGGKTMEGKQFLERSRAIFSSFKKEPATAKTEQLSTNEGAVQEKPRIASKASYKQEQNSDKVEESSAKSEQCTTNEGGMLQQAAAVAGAEAAAIAAAEA